MPDEHDRHNVEPPEPLAAEETPAHGGGGDALPDFNFVAAESNARLQPCLPDLENRDALFDYDIVPDDELLPDSEKRLAKRAEAVVETVATEPPLAPLPIVEEPEFVEPDFSISDAEDAEYTHAIHEDFDLADDSLTNLDDESPRTMLVASPRSRGGLPWRLAGHLAFSLLGLIAGYYILCWLNPRGNFLHLQLPGLHVSFRDWLGD